MIPILTVASMIKLQKDDIQNKDFSFYALLTKDVVNMVKIPGDNPLARETVTMYSKDMKEEIQSGKRYLLKGSDGFITTSVSNLWYKRKDIGKYTVLYTFTSEVSPVYIVEIYNRETMSRVVSLRLSDKNDFLHFVDKENVVQYIKHDDDTAYYDFYKVTKDKILHSKGKVNINHKDNGQYIYDTNFHTFFKLSNRDKSFFISPPVVNSKDVPKEKLLTVIDSTHVEQRTLYYKLFNSYRKCDSTFGYNIRTVYNSKTKRKEYAFIGLNDHIYATKGFPMYLLWSKALSVDGEYIGATYNQYSSFTVKELSPEKISTYKTENKYVYGFTLYKKNKLVTSFMRTVSDASSSLFDTDGHMYVKRKGKYVYVFLAYNNIIEMFKYNHNNFETPLFHRTITLEKKSLHPIFNNHADNMIRNMFRSVERETVALSSDYPYIHEVVYLFRTPKAISLYSEHTRMPVKVYNDNFFVLNEVLFYIDKKGKVLVSPYNYKKVDDNKYLVEITTPYNYGKKLEPMFSDENFHYILTDNQIYKQVILLDTITGTAKPLVFKDIKQQGAMMSMIMHSNKGKNNYIINLYGTKDVEKNRYLPPFRIIVSTVDNNGNTRPVFGMDSKTFSSIFSSMAYGNVIFTESNGALVAHRVSQAFSSMPAKDWRDILFMVKGKRLYNLNCSIGFRSMKALNTFTRDKEAVENLEEEEQR